MPLLNYSTKIEATITVSEIQAILAKHGARQMLIGYAEDGSVENMAFQIETIHGVIAFKLPIKPEAVLKILLRQYSLGQLSHSGKPDHAQAVRVGWRIIKDWVEGQMAILETEMVNLEQIFLPYMIIGKNRTLYEAMVDSHFQLEQGKES
ncbi:hypothetical protein ES703_30305 [subsurface metagenome]